MAAAEAAESNNSQEDSHRTILGAIHDKYDVQDDEFQFVIFVPKSAPGKKATGEIVVPRDLYLNKCNISHVGQVEEVTQLCADVNELHLADNNISQWEEVAKVLSCFPNICALNLNNNPVGSTPMCLANWPLDETFPKLKTLIVNYLYMPWESVRCLLQTFPNLREIHLSFNNFKTVCLDIFSEQTYPNIDTLNINGNLFEQWSEISKFGQLFPTLKVLHMFEIQITKFPDEKELTGKNFPLLESVCLKDCAFRSWSDIEKFRYLPNLNSIKLLGDIPILQSLGEKVRRQLILAYLPAITRLNGGRVGETEREDADRAFIRYYMDRDEKPERYIELEEQIGKLGPLVSVDLGSTTMCLWVTMEGKKPTLKTVNANWTAKMLRTFLASYAELGEYEMTLIYRRQGGGLTFPLNSATRTLLEYSIGEGDEITIQRNLNSDEASEDAQKLESDITLNITSWDKPPMTMAVNVGWTLDELKVSLAAYACAHPIGFHTYHVHPKGKYDFIPGIKFDPMPVTKMSLFEMGIKDHSQIYVVRFEDMEKVFRLPKGMKVPKARVTIPSELRLTIKCKGKDSIQKTVSMDSTIDCLKEELVDYVEVPLKDFKLVLCQPDGKTSDLRSWGTFLNNNMKEDDVLIVRKRKVVNK